MDTFVVKWLLSLVVGTIWVAVFTTIAERISGKLGGLLIGLPSTAVISLLFIGVTQGVDAAVTASVIVPLSSGLYCFFFISYLLFSRRSFKLGLLGSLLVWFSFAAVASKILINDIYTSSIIGFILIIVCIWWVVRNIRISSNKIPRDIVGTSLWQKAILSGGVISLVVLIGKLAGAKWGGIFATFPALTVSTFLITIKSGGIEFTRLVAKNVMISTTITVALFAILSHFFFPVFGVIVGVIVAYLGLLLISIPIYFLVIDKLKDR